MICFNADTWPTWPDWASLRRCLHSFDSSHHSGINFLLNSTIYFRSILCFPCISPGIGDFLRRLSSFEQRMVFSNQYLGSICAQSTGLSLLLGLVRARKHMNVHAQIYTYAFTHVLWWNLKMYHSDPSSRKDLLQKTALPNITPLLGQPGHNEWLLEENI